ncbi:MAG TPA: hypothetical protein ENJ23_03695, partial [Bacteroidetes bacterium]|nr:hypothetical protein [Bacteroidota bacterium]
GDKIPGLFVQYISYEKEKRPDVLYGFPNRIVSVPIAGEVLPPWFAEGVAQFQAPDEAYDFWDTHRDMILRMAVLKDKMLSYREMCSFGHTSLGNEMVYNSGFSLVTYIAKFYGYSSLERLASSMSSPVRLSFGQAVRAALGKSDTELYREWKSFLMRAYREGTAEIRKNTVRGELLERKGFGNFYPRWSPDGKKVAYVTNQGEDFLGLSALVIRDLGTGKLKVIRGGVASAFDFSPDGRFLVYARKKRANIYGSRFFDLFTYDLKRKKERRLTHGARARNPAWSPDGKKIVCVIGRDGTDNLAVYDLKEKTLTQITHFKNGEQIFRPDWSPGGHAIVFDLSTGHNRDLALIDARGRKLVYLIKDRGDARNPVFGPDGRSVYFSWDDTGIFNIYRLDLKTKDTEQLTNVLGGAFMPDFHSQAGLVYSLYTEDGYKIARLERPAPVKPARYLALRLIPRTSPVVPEDTGAEGTDGRGIASIKARPYRFTYGPLNVMPRVLFDYGTTKLGFYLYSSEVLEKYSIFGGFAMNRMWDMDIYGAVEYRQFFPTFFVEVYNQVRHTESEGDKYRYNLLETDTGLDFKLSDSDNLRTFFVYSRYAGRITTTVAGQQVKFGYTYMLGSDFAFQWTHQSIHPSRTMEINPRGGRRILLRYDRQHNKFLKGFTVNSKYGTIQEVYDPYRYNQVTLEWREYVGLPWGHALELRLNSGYIDRKVDSFFNFFAGGLIGLKGYPFYSIEGRKLLTGTAQYRFKISNNLDIALPTLKLDKLYAGVFVDYGNAWNSGEPVWQEFKTDVGLQLRMDTFMFYNFPTRIFFDAAYGLDEVTNRGQLYGKEWRFYFGFAFGYMD